MYRHYILLSFVNKINTLKIMSDVLARSLNEILLYATKTTLNLCFFKVQYYLITANESESEWRGAGDCILV
jgi:hypothetical protein